MVPGSGRGGTCPRAAPARASARVNALPSSSRPIVSVLRFMCCFLWFRVPVFSQSGAARTRIAKTTLEIQARRAHQRSREPPPSDAPSTKAHPTRDLSRARRTLWNSIWINLWRWFLGTLFESSQRKGLTPGALRSLSAYSKERPNCRIIEQAACEGKRFLAVVFPAGRSSLGRPTTRCRGHVAFGAGVLPLGV